MTEQTDSNPDAKETDAPQEARKSPYNINGPRTADPEDYDEDGNKVSNENE